MIFFLATKSEAELENKYDLIRGVKAKERLNKAINHFYECGIEKTLPRTFIKIKNMIDTIEDEELVNISKITKDIKSTIKLDKKRFSF